MSLSSEDEIRPGESNDDYRRRRAKNYDKDLLILALIKYIDRTKKRHSIPLWSLIGDATGHGCGISSALVEHFYPGNTQ